jgi:hypothetical protein
MPETRSLSNAMASSKRARSLPLNLSDIPRRSTRRRAVASQSQSEEPSLRRHHEHEQVLERGQQQDSMPKRGAEPSSASPDPNRAIVVSDSPLICLFEAFASPRQCEALLRMARVVDESGEYDITDPTFKWSTADQKLIEDVEKRLGHITGCTPHREEMPLLIMRDSRSDAASQRDRFPSKLHVDTNGGLPRRFASALLYLTTPCKGGQTVFPLAITNASRKVQSPTHVAALAASRRLLEARVYHTGHSKRPEARELEALTSSAPTVRTPPIGAAYTATAGGVAVRALAGNLLVFWTRDSNGIDARSWHAGESVAHDAADEKWLLRKFKEVPVAVFEDSDAMAAFVDRTRRQSLGEPRDACELSTPTSSNSCP